MRAIDGDKLLAIHVARAQAYVGDACKGPECCAACRMECIGKTIADQPTICGTCEQCVYYNPGDRYAKPGTGYCKFYGVDKRPTAFCDAWNRIL